MVDADGDDGDGIGVEILSSDDESLDDYLKDADELVMSPSANVSNRAETTCVGNLDENVPVEDMMTHVPIGTRKRKLLHRRQLARH